MKKLKKNTPDFAKAVFDKNGTKIISQKGIKKGDELVIDGYTHSLVSGKELTGKFYFDSYDSSNGTIFISPNHMMSITYNVSIYSVIRINTWRDTIPN